MMETVAHCGRDHCPQSLRELALVLDGLRHTSFHGVVPTIFQKYFVSPPHYFSRLCQSAITSERSQALPWDAWLTPDSPFRRLVRRMGREEQLWPRLQAHLLCARAASHFNRKTETACVYGEALECIGKETRLSRGFLRLLAAQLCNHTVDVEHEVTMPVLLVQDRGTLADLPLRLITPGCGDWYSAPETSLIHLHEDFRQGQETARYYVAHRLKWQLGERDLCWRLRPRDPEWPIELKGPSTSAATALLLAKLLALADGVSPR